MNNFAKQFRLTAVTLVIVLSIWSFTECENSGDGGSNGDNSAVIDIALIEALPSPVTGETPVTGISENAQYSGTVTWSPNHSTFAASTQYTATITLTAKTGYTLKGVAADLFWVAGAASVSNGANSGVITVEFPATGAVPVVITIAAIQGVAPVTSGTPVTAINPNAQYTGTVTWSPDHSTFAANTQYTATITLTPKNGYTLQGVAANFFTVAGATSVRNGANSGVITAVFSQAAEVLTVTNTTEWNNACNYIATGGNGTYNTSKAYIIMVSGDIAVPIVTQTFGSVSNVAITLQGNGTLSLNSQGKMIQTSSGQTLIIDSPYLTLQGPTDNNTPLIYCSGKLEMKSGTITGNVNVNSEATIYGGVVFANDFTMSGGTISGGSSVNSLLHYGVAIGRSYSYGGGVYVNNFTMSGGTISGSSSAQNGFYNISEGGGVYVRGNFTMSGGTINGSNSSCGNSTTSEYEEAVHSYGGGVYAGGSFIKTGGIIYGNDASGTNKNTVSGPNAYGHAVYLKSGYYRNSTLGASDNLSSSSPLPVNSGETLNGWTKR